MKAELRAGRIVEDVEMETRIWIPRVESEKAFLAIGQAVSGVVQIRVGRWNGVLLLPDVIHSVAILVDAGKWFYEKQNHEKGADDPAQLSADWRDDTPKARRKTGAVVVMLFHASGIVVSGILRQSGLGYA